MGRGGRVEVVSSKGCSKLLVDFSSSFRGIPSYSLEPLIMSPASSASVMSESTVTTRSNDPFYGLVICVTGLSKEARKQVMEATERLGGKYSPHLHPQCLLPGLVFLNVYYSFCGRKFEHASKHGSKNGLLVVTLAWFVDSVRRNVRLSESLYSVKGVGQGGLSVDDIDGLVQRASRQHSCLPVVLPENSKQADMIEEPLMHAEREPKRRTLLGHTFYVDGDVSDELRSKVIESAAAEGASLVDRWFVGCGASHVVCEGNSIQKYLGHSSNIVTPLWVLKSAKEKRLQRLVHMSADLARQTGALLDSIQNTINSKTLWKSNRGGSNQGLGTRSRERRSGSRYAVWFERRSCANNEPEPERPVKRPHVQAFDDKIRERLAWGKKEKKYQATIHTLEEKLRNVAFHNDIQVQEAEGERRRLAQENEALRAQIRRMKIAAENPARSRQDEKLINSLRRKMCDYGADLEKAEEELAKARAKLAKNAEELTRFAQQLREKYHREVTFLKKKLTTLENEMAQQTKSFKAEREHCCALICRLEESMQ
ncbi:hypothetical protein A4A49_29652 [Nicotiana attenuata]|uniref:BRCT domain-containing protein n=1 Tax=Nicotiana attenuata TaxID=49451 RepID=A0A314L4R3_NICAT|nr:hypothetical protein A4A49_29652 [Nicotiana attenuata]